MSKILSIALLLFSSAYAVAQPTNCFEISSILVDACAQGNSCNDASDPACQCEGKNEMFTFEVGPNELAVGDMNIDWPNGLNPFLGICQNATTAAHVTALNASIQNCGFLEEPTGGILPAGSKVLVITSVDFCVAANSFAGLSDTLIVLFQCPGNFYGHFANWAPPPNDDRTLTVDFGLGCDDQVTYYRSQLQDQNGGNSPQDGAVVEFDYLGNDSYYNNGCSAPVQQAEFEAGPNASLCDGTFISLSASISASDYADWTWSSDFGSFDDASSLNTLYIPDGSEPDIFNIYLSANGCSGTITDTVVVTNYSEWLTGIVADPSASVCPGEEVTLTAEGGASFFTWSTGVLSQEITVSDADWYVVQAETPCNTTVYDSIEVFVNQEPTVMVNGPNQIEICQGESVEVTAVSSEMDVQWSTGETTLTITISESDVFVISVENDCGMAEDSVDLVVLPDPTVSINPQGTVSLCDGQTIQLTASGEGDFVWSNNENGESISVSEVGIYEVTSANDCGIALDQVEVVFGGFPPNAEIQWADDLLICPGESLLLSGSGGQDYSWNGISGSALLDVTEPGEYVLLVENQCGTDMDQVVVQWDDLPAANLTSETFSICNGQSALVQVSGNGPFYWSDGGVANENVFDQTGLYYVYSESVCGTDTAFFQVIEELVNAQIGAEPLVGEAPLEVEFQSIGNGSEYYEWIFQDGTILSTDNVFHVFENEGQQEVILTVQSENGCTDQTTIIIGVGQCSFSLYVPNAFSPDSDGLNDQLRLYGNCIEKFSWTIFDRYGRVVYQSTEPEQVWTAADLTGFAVTDGAYPYIIDLTDSNGETHRFRGTVSIFR